MNEVSFESKVTGSYLETAKMDMKAAATLAKHEYFAQAMFCLEQAFEKSLKAFYYFYMLSFDRKDPMVAYREIRRFRHDNHEALMRISHNANNKYRSLTENWGAPIKDTVEGRRSFLSQVEKLNSLYADIALNYPVVMSKVLHDFSLLDDAQKEVLRELDMIAKSRQTPEEKLFVFTITNWYKSLLLADGSVFLAFAFKHIDKVTRYPLRKMNFSNVYRFASPNMKVVFNPLLTSVKEHIQLTTELIAAKPNSMA